MAAGSKNDPSEQARVRMRVIAGSRRSLPLNSPAGMHTRPTTDRIKETLFNILMPSIPGCRFLDVFAGSGGIGIEALSRGASYACFIEKDPRAASVIAGNLKFTKFENESTLLRMDAVRLLSSENKRDPFDVVFMDPPYGFYDNRDEVKALFSGNGWMHEETLIVLEADAGTDLSFLEEAGLEMIREKNYKTNKHVFFRTAPDNTDA